MMEEVDIKATLKIIVGMEKVYFMMKMEAFMMENGKTIKCMAMENYILSKQHLYMQAIGNKIDLKEKDIFLILIMKN
jgi:hypothetical protein